VLDLELIGFDEWIWTLSMMVWQARNEREQTSGLVCTELEVEEYLQMIKAIIKV